MWQGDTPAAVNAWTRSAYSGNGSNFCLVNTDGTPNNNNADNSRALADLMVATVPGDVGMYLGVEPSQQEMVALPSYLDNWMKCQLSLHGMGHYMDDYNAILESVEQVAEWLKGPIAYYEQFNDHGRVLKLRRLYYALFVKGRKTEEVTPCIGS